MIIRLAISPAANTTKALVPLPCSDGHAAAILVAFPYLEAFEAYRPQFHYRDWMMDSGAYSAWNSGTPISMLKYMRTCQRLLMSDPTLKEIIALDVINDGKTSRTITGRLSLANALLMQENNLEVIPVFHVGEDWGILHEYCQRFTKVGLSCRFGEELAESLKFYDQAFAREWPKRFHSFGWIGTEVVYNYPFHSGDSASWRVGPLCFGNWKKFGMMSVRDSNVDLRSQLRYYWNMEQKTHVRWAKERKVLDALPAKPLCRKFELGQPMVTFMSQNLTPEQYLQKKTNGS